MYIFTQYRVACFSLLVPACQQPRPSVISLSENRSPWTRQTTRAKMEQQMVLLSGDQVERLQFRRTEPRAILGHKCFMFSQQSVK